MKVLLLGFTKISYMPYMNFYINQLKKRNFDIHLLYWDRDGEPDSIVPDGITAYRFASYMEDSIPLRNKIGSFIKYRNFASKILKKNKFDLLIILHSTPGIVLFDILKRNYKNKYILDYRDFTYENYGFYRKLIHRLVNNSICTFVSSNAYRRFLPKVKKIYTSHNLIFESLNHQNIWITKKRDTHPIRIRYWGFIRQEKINLKIIDKLGNDNRFELHYHGREQETAKNLKKYCEEQKFKNIFFHGEYKPEERYVFATETDLLHNIYDNDIKTINAMGNKYYDGIIFHIPQLCNEGSFMGNEVTVKEIGIECNPLSDYFVDDLYRYYHSIDWNTFGKSCDVEIDRIIKEYKDGEQLLSIIQHCKEV